MQMGNQIRALSALSPGKGPSLPTGQEAIDILEWCCLGHFFIFICQIGLVFGMGLRVKTKFL
jgi:hypothetical protein